MAPALFVLLALAAGFAATVQGAVNGGLSGRIGLGPTIQLNTIVAVVIATGLWVAQGARGGWFPAGTHWSYYIGGVCGFVIIAGLAMAFPRLGAAYAIGLVVLGQGLMALAVDHYGFWGMAREPISAGRIAGIVLLCVGVVLLKR
jgi:bacterial/archaeal transporter family-2 protein